MAKNKSIAQTVNLQGTPQAPAYKVAAQQVDTFVKGRSAEQILAQDSRMKVAANIDAIVETGAAANKIMYEKQVASLDTLAGQLQTEFDDGTITKLEESQDFTNLPATLQVQMAQTIGKRDARNDFNTLRAKLYADPNLAMTDASIEGLLSEISPVVDGLDGYSIHRQSAQKMQLDVLKSDLRNEALGIRRAEHQKQVNFTHKVALGEILNGAEAQKLTAIEIHEKLAAASIIGLAESDYRDNYYNAVKDFAESTGRTDILDPTFIDERFKDSSYKYLYQSVQADNLNKQAEKIRDDETIRLHTIAVEERKIAEGIHERLMKGEIIDPNSDDFKELTNDQLNLVRTMISNNDTSKYSSKDSQTVFALELAKIRKAAGTGNELQLDGKTYAIDNESMIDYVNRLKLNAAHRGQLLQQLPSIVQAGDISSTPSYNESMKVPVSELSPQSLAGTGQVSEAYDNAKKESTKLLDKVEEYHAQLYREAMETGGVVDVREAANIKREVRAFALELKSDWQATYVQGEDGNERKDAASLAASLVDGKNDEQVEATPVSKPKNKRQTRAEIAQRNKDKNQQLAEQKEVTADLVAQMTDAEKKKYNRTKQIPERLRNKTD